LELGRNEKKSSFSRNVNKESSKVQGVCILWIQNVLQINYSWISHCYMYEIQFIWVHILVIGPRAPSTVMPSMSSLDRGCPVCWIPGSTPSCTSWMYRICDVSYRQYRVVSKYNIVKGIRTSFCGS
jgi:hypothetical protein